jgi:site-specific DNA-methyltransferase (adenine-specific)
MLPYEDAVRPFTVDSDVPFTDVWHFPSVRPFPGKHPAEKPLEMLSHMIAASSYPGDIVLDCFSGSGSTAVAAIGLARRAVCVEINHSWNLLATQALSGARSTRDTATPSTRTGPKVQPVVL